MFVDVHDLNGQKAPQPLNYTLHEAQRDAINLTKIPTQEIEEIIMVD